MNFRDSLSLTPSFLSIGANVGNKIANIALAIRRLGATEGIFIEALSKFYKTAPQNYTDQNWFVNAAIKIQTTCSPKQLLDVLQTIEKEQNPNGKPFRFGPRKIDLDIVFYGQRVINTATLVIPHPRMHERAFVLKPLCDIDRNLVHPLNGLTVGELFEQIKIDDSQAVIALAKEETREIFIDTANIEQIKDANDMGMVDGVTTNPSLIAKEEGEFKDIIAQICKIVDGPVSAEVISLEYEGMVAEARELVKIADNIAVKIPMTVDGLKAVKTLSAEGINTNVTLVFSALQALMAAKAGATYVSPFVGRLDDLAQEGMGLIEEIVQIFTNYDFDTQIIVASVRSQLHVLQSALMGADIATIPYDVLKKLAAHHMTDKGIESFLADWKKKKKKKK